MAVSARHPERETAEGVPRPKTPLTTSQEEVSSQRERHDGKDLRSIFASSRQHQHMSDLTPSNNKQTPLPPSDLPKHAPSDKKFGAEKVTEVKMAMRPSQALSPLPRNWPSFESTSTSKIEVIVPSSQRQDCLSPFPRPMRKQINRIAEKEALLGELKRSTAPAVDRLEEVERLFGQIGFSKGFNTDADEDRMRKLAPAKKKKVDRSSVKLDWGSSTPTAFNTPGELVHPQKQVKEILTDRFHKPFGPPLSFANNVNDRRLNGKFQFTDRYILRTGVREADPGSNYGCRDCGGQCHPSTCECLQKDVDDDDSDDDDDGDDPRGRSGGATHREQIQTYVRRADGLVVLSDNYIERELNSDAKHFEITECNELCPCGPDCWNRVVGKGRTVPLEIYETEKCGFGVRSSADIFRGQFIELYLGEVITQRELERREDAKDSNASSYIYSLDWFNGLNPNCNHVDGEYFGTAMRFVNHSCQANARCFPVQIHKNDQQVYYLAFFAIKDIRAGTEITIDYSPRDAGKVYDLEDEDVDDGLVRCYCGEPNCRRLLWRPSKARRRKRQAKND